MANKIITEEKTFDLGEFRFGDTIIPCNSFKISYKMKNERVGITNQYEGAGWKSSEVEYDWECSEVLPQYAPILKRRFHDQAHDKHGLTISTYDFVEGGDYEEQDVLYSCVIDSIDFDREKGKKITVKGQALRAKVKK